MKTQQTTATKTRKGAARKQPVQQSGVDIQQMIAEAAYYHAEHRGFQGGSMDDDWLLAEAEIEALLSQEQPH